MKQKNSTTLLKEYKKMQTAKIQSRRTSIVLLFIILVTSIFPKLNNTWISLSIMIISLFILGIVTTINVYNKHIVNEITNSLIKEGYIELENKFVGEYDIKDKRKIEKQYKIKIFNKIKNIDKFYLYADEVKYLKHHNEFQQLINQIYRTNKNYQIYSYSLSKHDYFNELLDYKLEDDETESGGVSFEGYTVEDYIEETGLIKDIDHLLNEPNLTTLNKHLKESGIKPINLDKLDKK